MHSVSATRRSTALSRRPPSVGRRRAPARSAGYSSSLWASHIHWVWLRGGRLGMRPDRVIGSTSTVTPGTVRTTCETHPSTTAASGCVRSSGRQSRTACPRCRASTAVLSARTRSSWISRRVRARVGTVTSVSFLDMPSSGRTCRSASSEKSPGGAQPSPSSSNVAGRGVSPRSFHSRSGASVDAKGSGPHDASSPSSSSSPKASRVEAAGPTSNRRSDFTRTVARSPSQ